MRRFGLAAVCVVVPIVVLTTYLLLQAGHQPVGVLRDIGQALAALAALASTGWLARRSTGRVRWAWALLAVSAVTALVVEVAEAAYTIGSGAAPRFLSAADVAVAAAIPAAIAGLLLFPREVNQYGALRRAGLDVAMVALSLTFIGSALSLPQLFVRFASPGGSWIGLAFPVLDLVLLAAIFLALRWCQAWLRAQIAFVAGGLAVIAISDSAAVFLAAAGHLTALRELLSAGSMYGFALVAVAPLWPQAPEEPIPESHGDMPLWSDLIPYVGVTAVAVTAVVMSIARQPMTAYAAASAGGLALVLLGSHLLSREEARHILRQSRRAEARMREREVLLNNVVDHAPQGVATIAPERRIVSANPRLASMLYAPLPVLAGALTDTFLPESYVARVFRSFAAIGTGAPETYESDCQARRADGSQFWIHWSVTPIRKADGTIDYFLATFEDVTAKREAEETAVANLAQLEKLNRLKSEFVSMVSHEFRTALVGIQGFSELIKDQDMEAAEIKILAEEIYNDSQRLNRMITEMLDFDRLEAGKLRLDLKRLDINQLARDAIEHAAVSTKKHTIQAELQPGLPDVFGDPDRLFQVLTNLLSNAIKYSPTGGEICVGTRLNGGAVEVAVQDHGRGIPPEFINRLFGRYERYEDKYAGKIIGTGLGLAITRQIVEMHGGRITVDSVVGRGSEFRFTVPLASTAASITRSA
ncbi:MAG TPA: PAS domain-containing sensor histidine kinase [Candidatus Limnocylindrales bacterium]|nr:PAS domain-containing sensor histidine kinase [Candidatus Limnocylindrales bacterium]